MSDELQKIDNTNNIISTPDGDIDLSVLPEKERTEILAKYAKDFVDLQSCTRFSNLKLRHHELTSYL